MLPRGSGGGCCARTPLLYTTAEQTAKRRSPYVRLGETGTNKSAGSEADRRVLLMGRSSRKFQSYVPCSERISVTYSLSVELISYVAVIQFQL